MEFKVIPFLTALLFAPLLLGVINQTKAFFAGRVGQPLFQAYYDILKYLRKGAVYSRTTSWIFRAGPIVGLAAVLTALALTPAAGRPSLFHFSGDFIFLASSLAIARFFLVLAALDTGSSFEGMGASREITLSALAEPALLVSFAALARQTERLSLTEIYASLSQPPWLSSLPVIMLVVAALFVVLLAENARMPVDDPNTHLELTMIHEVMVLDHGGPDLGFILYGSALKLWLLGSLVVGIVLPVGNIAVLWAGMMGLAVLIGCVESIMARLRLSRIPPLLIGAGACALFALLLILGGTR